MPEDLQKYKDFYLNFRVVWKKKQQDLRKFAANLSSYTKKVHEQMISDLGMLQNAFTTKCAIHAEEAVQYRARSQGGLEECLRKIDEMRSEFDVFLTASQRARMPLPSEVDPLAFEDLENVGEKPLLRTISLRIEALRTMQEQLLQPFVEVKSTLEQQKRWVEPPRSKNPTNVGDALQATIGGLLRTTTQALADVDFYRQNPSLAVLTLPQLKSTTPTLMDKVTSTQRQTSPRRKAAAAVRANRLLPHPQMELVAHVDGSEVVSTTELRGHARDKETHNRQLNERLEKGIVEKVDPFKNLKNDHAKTVRQRKRMETDNIVSFLNVLNKEVAMMGPQGARKRREEAEHRQFQLASLRPTTKNSAATLNSSSPHFSAVDAVEEPAAGKILKRKLAKSRRGGEE